MKELELKIIDELLYFFTYYITIGVDDKLKEKAIEIESKYLFSSPLVSDFITQVLGKLVNFYATTERKVLTKKEAEEIIKKLKKRKQELESQL